MLLDEFFAKLTFRVDDAGLNNFKTKLDALEKQLKNLGHGSGNFNKIAEAAEKASKKTSKALTEAINGSNVDKAWKDYEKKKKEQQRLDNQISKQQAARQKQREKEDARSKKVFEKQADDLAKAEQRQAEKAAVESRRIGIARDRMEMAQKIRERTNRIKEQRKASAEQIAEQKRVSSNTMALERQRSRAVYANFQREERLKESERKRIQRRMDQAEQIANRNRSRRSRELLGIPGAALGSRFLAGGGILAGAAAAGYTVKKFSDIIGQTQSQKAMFQSVFEGKQQGDNAYANFQNMADKYGFNYRENAQSYSGLVVSAKDKIGVDKTNELFGAFSAYARTAGATSEQYKNALLAIEQMFGKNQVQSQELKLQLGNALPEAQQIFAQAFAGGDMSKLMDMVKGGQIKGKDLVKLTPVFQAAANRGGGFDAAMKTLPVQMVRFDNAISRLGETLDKIGAGDGIGSVIGFITDKINGLNEELLRNKDLIRQIGNVVSAVFKPFVMLIDRLFSRAGLLATVLFTIGKTIGRFAPSLYGIGFALGKLVSLAKRFALPWLLIYEVMDEITGWLTGDKETLLEHIFGPAKNYTQDFKDIANSIKDGVGALGVFKTTLEGIAKVLGGIKWFFDKLNQLGDVIGTNVADAEDSTLRNNVKFRNPFTGSEGGNILPDLKNYDPQRSPMDNWLHPKGASAMDGSPFKPQATVGGYASGGTTGTSSGNTFHIYGATDPNAVATAVDNKLKEHTNTAKSAYPKTPR